MHPVLNSAPNMAKSVLLVMLPLAWAGCTDHPTGVTTTPAERYLQAFSLSVGQQVDIRPSARIGYDSVPEISSSAVSFLGMDRSRTCTPEGCGGDLQDYHFLATASGQAVVTIRYRDGAPAVGDTINVVAAVPHGAFSNVSTGFLLNTCAVTTGGMGYCWGGQGPTAADTLGDAATPWYAAPVPVAGGLTFDAISRGLLHACGVTTGRAAYCWGDNFNGQLGDGDSIDSPVPKAVVGGLAFKVVSAGVYHACGVTTAGAIFCWGNNHGGELGNGTISYTNSQPIPVSSDSSFIGVAAGYQFSCGLTTSGAAYCWGDNEYGELGTGDTTFSAVPVAVSGALKFVALSVGYFHACGLTASGAAYCWGGNFEGELGNGTTRASTTPVAVSGGLTFAAISAGQWATCGVTTSGAAFCWGYNGFGQLGSATIPLTIAPNSTPVPVSGVLTFATINTGYYHTCGVTTAGVAYCWGDDSEGELGDGSTKIHPTPARVFGP